MSLPCEAVAGDRWGRRSREGVLAAPVVLVGGTMSLDIAALILANDYGAVCWYNRRTVHGPCLGLVELWARRAVASGWYSVILTARDLSALI